MGGKTGGSDVVSVIDVTCLPSVCRLISVFLSIFQCYFSKPCSHQILSTRKKFFRRLCYQLLWLTKRKNIDYNIALRIIIVERLHCIVLL